MSLEQPRIQKWPQNLSHSTHKIDFGTNITKKNFNNIDSNAWRSTTNMKCLKFAKSDNLMQRWHFFLWAFLQKSQHWSNIQNTTMAHFKAFFIPHDHFFILKRGSYVHKLSQHWVKMGILFNSTCWGYFHSAFCLPW